jgi:pyrimidine-nucleoside phosphorylase/thymidine phosphorylase
MLSDDVIRRFIAGSVAGEIPDYQIAALLMAIVFRGLSPRELATWTAAMVASGDVLSLDGVAGRKVDKHSTGGVGDKVTLCLAPLVAACGVRAPMLVGRSLGHTGGTLDKLEAIAGFRVTLSAAEFRRVLARAGFVIAGQTPRLVPADRIFYALRDATATVESIPLIASSILSKKIAGGADALVMDVKVGRGAFLPSARATRLLAETIVRLGNSAGLRTVALLTAMDQPLGRQIGNALEVAEAIDVLRGAGPADTRALTVRLGAEMLTLGGKSRDVADGARRIEAAIASGDGLARFIVGVRLQGGDVRQIEDPRRLPRARRQLILRAPRAGFVSTADARLIGQAATLLGAGRSRKEDRVDPAVGITLHARVGDQIGRGEGLCTVWYNDGARLRAARGLLDGAFVVGSRKPAARRLIMDVIR